MPRRSCPRAILLILAALLAWWLAWLADQSGQPVAAKPVIREDYGRIILTTATNSAGRREVLVLTSSTLAPGQVPFSLRLRNWLNDLTNLLSSPAGGGHPP